MLVCFVDLDGVLVDFVAGALAVHGKTLARREVKWSFPEQIGFAGADDAAFWEPLGFDFWAGLGWHEDGRRLLGELERLVGADRIALLTSPCLTRGAVEGKVEWLRRRLPRYARQFFVGPAKHLCAGPGKVLVDDHDANVDRFVGAGGRAVLVPRPWNRRAVLTDETGYFPVDFVLHEIGRVLDETKQTDTKESQSCPR